MHRHIKSLIKRDRNNVFSSHRSDSSLCLLVKLSVTLTLTFERQNKKEMCNYCHLFLCCSPIMLLCCYQRQPTMFPALTLWGFTFQSGPGWNKGLGRGLGAASCPCNLSTGESQNHLKPSEGSVFPSQSHMKNSDFQTLVGLRQHSERPQALFVPFCNLSCSITLAQSFMALLGTVRHGDIIDINLGAVLEIPSVSSHSTFLFPLLSSELIVRCLFRNVMKLSGASDFPFFPSFPSGVEIVSKGPDTKMNKW